MSNQRALFEAWYKDYAQTLYDGALPGNVQVGPDENYLSSYTRVAWDAWNARWNTKIGAKHENS